MQISPSEQPIQPSDSTVQLQAEALILVDVGRQLGVELIQKVGIAVGDARAEVDGASADQSVLVEVFARIGKLRGAQLHKVSTDVLKLLAIRESKPDSTLVLAFADQEAADSIVGWRAAVLKHNRIEKVVADLPAGEREAIRSAQRRQNMGNAPEAGSS